MKIRTRQDEVLNPLLTAGMHAANAAATVGYDDDFFYGQALASITRLIFDTYGAHCLFRELSSSSALVLMLREKNVTLGEITFRRDGSVWTFDIAGATTDKTGRGLLTAARLVTSYANLLDQYGEDWATSDENPWDTEASFSDEDTWEAVFAAIPEGELIHIAGALFVISGVLLKWCAA